MNVSVNFFGVQRKIVQQDKICLELGNEASVSDLLQHIRTSYPGLSLDEHSIMVTVNNRVSSLDQNLNLNDNISIISHLGGG